MPSLGVNIDHVASVRQARYRDAAGGAGASEPDPVRAVFEAELGGADCITVHLREDRRHINDRDLELIRRIVRVKLNLEMGATDEMIGIAISQRVPMVTLVPEGRQEVTTEGGLDVAGQAARMKSVVASLHGAGIVVSAFIDPIAKQIEAAAAAGFDACEVHTGPYARAFQAAAGDFRTAGLRSALDAVSDAGRRIVALGMRFNAGHALNYANVKPIAALPGIEELHIGHSIVSRGVFVGLREAVREMKALIA